MAKETIIIGGSIAGLMCGIMLKHHGHNVTILEKDISDVREGYDAGIGIGKEVHEFLRKHNRVTSDFTIMCEAPTKLSLEGKAKPAHNQTMTSTSWGLLVSILRANFDGLTTKAVPIAPKSQQGDGNVVFRTGATVTHINDSGTTVQVEFKDISKVKRTLEGDIVVVADRSTSSTRQLLLPKVHRRFAGYVSWRGTVREDEIPIKTNDQFAKKLVFHFMDRNYMLHYTVPTEDGSLSPGNRLHNWIWYQKVGEDSREMQSILTDIDGVRHRGTVPRGLVDPDVWQRQKLLAIATMPPELAEIINKTSTPFLTKIYEVNSPEAVFLNEKVFLVGDAQTTIRPNAGMGTDHAAHDCNELEKVIVGTQTSKQWQSAVLRYAAAQQRFAMMIASYGLDSKWAMFWNTIRWLLLLFSQKLGLA